LLFLPHPHPIYSVAPSHIAIHFPSAVENYERFFTILVVSVLFVPSGDL
jgi:hypothetical protein